MMVGLRVGFVVLVCTVLAPVAAGAAPCDPLGTDAAALVSTWDAVDVACPCDAAAGRREYAACAKAVVKSLEVAGTLPRACRKVARQRARLSVCGRPGAAVCCRTAASGIVKGRIVNTPARCIAPNGGAACVADHDFVTGACSAAGCVACGNGVVEPGEGCEPPGTLECSAECQPIATCGNGFPDPGEECDPPGVGSCLDDCTLAKCGNGVVEAGESCEPPGSAGCTDACTTGTCDDAPAGEIAVACVASHLTNVALAAGAQGYLVAWEGHLASGRDLVRARRLDAAAAPVDTLPLSVGDPNDLHGAFTPLATGDGHGWYVGWSGSYPPFYSVRGARVTSDGTVTGRHTLADGFSFGSCQTQIYGPVGVATEADGQFAQLLTRVGGCQGQIIFAEHPVTRVTFAGDAATVSSLGTPDPFVSPPAVASAQSAAIASGGGDTIAVIPQSFVDWSTGSPVIVDTALMAYPRPTGAAIRLASADAMGSTGAGVAWGMDGFLAAWSARPAGSPVASEVRALRFTTGGGPLDPDEGILLASGTTVNTTPAIVFDGTTWLVVWAAGPSLGPHDLYAVSVRPDGTLVDATPQVIATGVVGPGTSLTSRGDGWLLGLLRPAGPGLWSVNVRPVE